MIHSFAGHYLTKVQQVDALFSATPNLVGLLSASGERLTNMDGIGSDKTHWWAHLDGLQLVILRSRYRASGYCM